MERIGKPIYLCTEIKNGKIMKKVNLLTALLVVLMSGAANAQEEEGSPLTYSAGVRSSEIWRGGYVCGLAGEGGIDFSAGGFSAGIASVFAIGKDTYNEFDWYASYSVKGFSLTLNDYCWTQADGFEYFGPYKENHYLELGVGYDFAECTDLPLSVSYNVMLAGANRKANGDQAHASYLEFCYAPSLECGIDLAFTLGAAIESEEESAMYTRKDGFNFAVVGLDISKTYNLKNFCTVTPSVSAICNPTGPVGTEHGAMYFTAGVSFGF